MATDCKSKINSFYTSLGNSITSNSSLQTAYQNAIGECSSTGDISKAIGYIGDAALSVVSGNADATKMVNDAWYNADNGYAVAYTDSTPSVGHTPVTIPSATMPTTTDTLNPTVVTGLDTSAATGNNNWMKWAVGILIVGGIAIWAWKKYGSQA